ncbi:hypothetical protein [Leptospira fluminis]|uniref:hypothetical protein n=1 Tax=Leptospira fluminis TaxID=2484979 RepID=UPI00143C007C|nr:hypothetical protein [Leptospira fluminis]
MNLRRFSGYRIVPVTGAGGGIGEAISPVGQIGPSRAASQKGINPETDYAQSVSS